MELFTYLPQDPQKFQAREFRAAAGACAGFITDAEEVVGNEIKVNPGVVHSEGAPTPPTTEAYHTQSLQKTIETLRAVRDEYFLDNVNSSSGAVLGQVTLILQRLQHDIPSGRGSFHSLLRAARLAERETVEV